MREDEGSVEFVGLFEDNKLVATMKIVKFSMEFLRQDGVCDRTDGSGGSSPV